MPDPPHNRTIILSRHPRRHVVDQKFNYLICPGDIAARQLGFPPVSLDEIARQNLEANGITIAPEHLVLRIVASILTKQLKVEDCSGMARALSQAINTLMRSGADLGRIARLATGRPQLIAETAHVLRGYLADNSYCTKADAITSVVERLDDEALGKRNDEASEFKSMVLERLVVFGYARLIEMEYRVINHLAGPGSKVYIPYLEGDKLFGDNQRAAEFLAAHGWSVETPDDRAITPGQRAGDAFLGIASELEGVSASSFPIIEEEVRGVLRQVKHSLQSGEYTIEDVALVARTESTYGEWVREIAWEYELPVVTHYSVTLLETRAGQWLNSLLEVCESGDFPFEATARLFQHTLGTKLRGETWGEDKWDEARQEHARGAAQWDRLGLTIEQVNWPSEAARSEWCERIRTTMRVLELRTLSKYRPQDLVAYEKLYDALDEFSLPRAEILSRSEFVTQLRDLLRVTSVPSDTASSGIEVHTPLSLYGASVKHVFVLGEAEGELPRPIADDAMLDFHDRKALSDQNLVKLESAAQAARRETLSFYSLLLAAEESLSFSYPRLDGSSVVRPSPFIRRMNIPVNHRGAQIEIAASRSELLRYQMQMPDTDQSDEYVMRAILATEVVKRREENRSIDEYNGLLGVSLSADDYLFSPSQITTFGQCDYKWFAQKLLKLGDPEEAQDDLAANLKGLLFHEVLNRLLSKFKNEVDVRGAMLAALHEAFDDIASGMSELTRLSGWRGRRFELLAQLTTAINGEEFLAENSKVLATEQSFKGDCLGIRVAGRLDRMDRTPDGLLIIDYKTSGSVPKGAKDVSGRLKLDVQLPIYRAVGSNQAGGEPVSGYYYSLTKGEILGKKGTEPDEDGLQALVNRLRSNMDSGTYPVEPDVDGAACQYCELDILCRKGPYLFRNQEADES